MRPFFLWSLEKTIQFPRTSTVQMFGGECRSCSRQKKSGSPRLWSSRYLGDLIDVPIEADAKDLRPVSCTNRNQEQRFGDSLNRLMRCAEQTGKINWNYLDEGNQCGFFMLSFDLEDCAWHMYCATSFIKRKDRKRRTVPRSVDADASELYL